MVVINTEEIANSSPSAVVEDKLAALQNEIDNYKDIFNSTLLVISNEFIKPLTSIKGYTGLLEGSFREMGGMAEKEMRYFRKTGESINDLEDLIRTCARMLCVNKARQFVGEMKKIGLSGFVDEIRKKYCKQPERVVNDIDKSIPEVRLQSKYLEIALGNLFSNAEKFGGKSKPARVTAALSKDKTIGAENFLVINICDYGTGIPEDMTKKVFLPFFRVEPSDGGSGLGLGLTMAEDAILFMNGKIDLQSMVGRGTTVIVSVPVIISNT